MKNVRWKGRIHLGGRSTLVKQYIKVCPVCGDQHFESAKRPGFHPLARYFCKKHRGFFFTPFNKEIVIRK